MAIPTNSTPKSTKKIGAPMLEAMMVQNTPNIPAAIPATPPIADEPRPGLTLLLNEIPLFV